MGAIGKGSATTFLREDDMRSVLEQAIDSGVFNDRRVLVLIPDGTRTMPMPLMFRLLQEQLKPRTRSLDFLVALGTHTPMSDAQLSKLIGAPVANGVAEGSHIFNHDWTKPETFAQLGSIPAIEIEELSSGRLRQEVPVKLNRLILDYDHILICGPVFPHEVVGFSGGNKYFFPGIGGPEIINFTHWLGALITCYEVIGAGYTPVRAVIDRAASLVPKPVTCLSLVTVHDGVYGIYYGSAKKAWKCASLLSSQVHVRSFRRPFQRVLSMMPAMYDDLWTAAKGMYKLEPVVADGGEVIIYSPKLTEVSYTHGKLIDEIGYHCRDYFVKQWERFKHYPGGVLAHSTHVKGLGTYDADTGIESARIRVTLATAIPEERCRKINLGYMDPASIELDEWRNREEEGMLMVERAGEILHRLVREQHASS